MFPRVFMRFIHRIRGEKIHPNMITNSFIECASLTQIKGGQDSDSMDSGVDLSAEEILDEMTTHRGELKYRSGVLSERQFQVNLSLSLIHIDAHK